MLQCSSIWSDLIGLDSNQQPSVRRTMSLFPATHRHQIVKGIEPCGQNAGCSAVKSYLPLFLSYFQLVVKTKKRENLRRETHTKSPAPFRVQVIVYLNEVKPELQPLRELRLPWHKLFCTCTRSAEPA